MGGGGELQFFLQVVFLVLVSLGGGCEANTFHQTPITVRIVGQRE